MDPLTLTAAALNLATKIAEIILISIQSQPPEVRAEYARIQFEDFKKFRDWLISLYPNNK